MKSLKEVEQIKNRFAEQEFFNSNFMSVGLSKDYDLIVYLRKRIRTDNLPQIFEGLKVIYNFS